MHVADKAAEPETSQIENENRREPTAEPLTRKAKAGAAEVKVTG